MKKQLSSSASWPLLAAFTGCEEPLACEEGNKATLTVYNYTACTLEVGDVVPGGEDLNATFLVDVTTLSSLNWTKAPTTFLPALFHHPLHGA